MSKVLLACLMHNNRKRRLAAAAALLKSVNVKNASTAENGGVMHSSPVALERYVAIHFPSFSLYMASTGAVISSKSGVFAVALLDKAMPLSLSPQCKCHDPR